MSSGNEMFHGGEPMLPLPRPQCSLFPSARARSSFSLSGLNFPSLISFIVFLRFAMGVSSIFLVTTHFLFLGANFHPFHRTKALLLCLCFDLFGGQGFLLFHH